MEVLVVVAIIVVLAGIATVSFNYLSNAKVDATKARIQKVEQAVMSYKLRLGQFPGALAELTQAQADGSRALLEPGDILDEWGQPIQFDPSTLSQTGRPKLWSQNEPGSQRPPIANWQ